MSLNALLLAMQTNLRGPAADADMEAVAAMSDSGCRIFFSFLKAKQDVHILSRPDMSLWKDVWKLGLKTESLRRFPNQFPYVR